MYVKSKWIWLIVGIFLWGIVTVSHLEPEHRVYPLAMGFDISEKGYEVYYDIPDLSRYTGEGKPMEQEERVWHFVGSDSQEIEKSITQSKKETPDMGHVQVILLSKDVLNNPDAYRQILTSFVNKPMMGSSAYAFGCENLSGVMNTASEKTDSLGAYLVDLVDKISEVKPVLLQDLYNAYYNGTSIPDLMEIQTKDGQLLVSWDESSKFIV